MGQTVTDPAQKAADAAKQTIFDLEDPINESVSRFFLERDDEKALLIYNGSEAGTKKATGNGLENGIHLYIYCLFERYWWPWTRDVKSGGAEKLKASQDADHGGVMMVGINSTIRVVLRKLVQYRKDGGYKGEFTAYIYEVARNKCREAFFRKKEQAKFESGAVQPLDDFSVEDMDTSDDYNSRSGRESGPNSYHGTNDLFLVEDTAEIVMQLLFADELWGWMTDGTINDLQRKVLLYRYDWENLGSVGIVNTCQEVADRMHISKQAVNKQEKIALGKLVARWEASRREGT